MSNNSEMRRFAGTHVSRRDFLAASGCAIAAAACRPALSEPAGDEPVHEARHYEILPDGPVQCGLCPRQCFVPEGERGYCGVRENRNGKYLTLNYGRPCAANLDPIEKKPFFHVYPGSQSFSIAAVGCNIECRFCQNWEISRGSPDEVKAAYRTPAQIAAAAAGHKARTIAYTYGEPVVFYEYMCDCARAARDAGIENVVVSNGYIREDPLKELLPLVRAVKIDLKAFTQSFYGEVCDGELQPVLDTLKRLAGAGVWFEIVVLLIPTLNDSPDELKRMAGWITKELGPNVPLHFSRFHPAYKMRNLPPTPVATLEQARGIALAEGCRFVYIGNAPGVEGQNTFCPSCKTLLVQRQRYHVADIQIEDGKCVNCGTAIPGIWN